MTRLLRAPRECGSWYWDLYDFAEPGLRSALAVAARMCDVLAGLELLTPTALRYRWYVLDVGATGVTTTLGLTGELSDPSVPERVVGSRPTAQPAADIADIDVLGAGKWIDADGRSWTEFELVNLSLSTAPTGLSAEIRVHHDVWGWHDFAGRPQPAVYEKNAPRLTAALTELTSLLGMAPEPGEPTYFGASTREGIATREVQEDGMGPDVTDRL
ncbi:hypothetical protein ACFUJY_11020 [Streptomyces sp. NPDC057249]|uniref:hypothetical protein n=1 Tax=Streptomyces sp. NPDC057249 TaxID=3346067 RepID=UPI00363EFBB2